MHSTRSAPLSHVGADVKSRARAPRPSCTDTAKSWCRETPRPCNADTQSKVLCINPSQCGAREGVPLRLHGLHQKCIPLRLRGRLKLLLPLDQLNHPLDHLVYQGNLVLTHAIHIGYVADAVILLLRSEACRASCLQLALS